MKHAYKTTVFLALLALGSFGVSPTVSLADMPQASEQFSKTVFTNDTPGNYTIFATSTGVTLYITDLLAYFDSGTPIKIYCGNSNMLIRGQYQATAPLYHFTSPVTCTSAAVWVEALDAGGITRNAVFTVTGYSQTDARKNYPLLVSTSTVSTGGGGGGGGVTTLDPSTFNGFYLYEGYILFFLTLFFFVWFFRKK